MAWDVYNVIQTQIVTFTNNFQEVTWSPLRGYKELGGSSETPVAISAETRPRDGAFGGCMHGRLLRTRKDEFQYNDDESFFTNYITID